MLTFIPIGIDKMLDLDWERSPILDMNIDEVKNIFTEYEQSLGAVHYFEQPPLRYKIISIHRLRHNLS